MEEYNNALKYCFLLLKYRSRTKQEITRRLKLKKYPVSIIEAVTEFLQSRNFINDCEFVFSFVTERLKKGFSSRRISFELKRLGVADELIEKALATIDRDQYMAMIRRIGLKKVSDYRNKDNIRLRVFRYLKQRGFAADDIEGALDDLSQL